MEPINLATITKEIDSRVCSLQRIAAQLKQHAEEAQLKGAILNLEAIESRANCIAVMRHMHTELQKLLALVAKNGQNAEIIHRNEIKVAQEGLVRAQDTHWGRAAAPPEPRAAVPAAPRPPNPRARVPVAEGTDLALEATVLPEALRRPAEVFAAIQGGELYYVPAWRHFAFRVGPCVLHAGLGRIYRPGETPERVKECYRQGCTGRGCRYYHDPEVYPGGDVRNYMADSWLYMPPGAMTRYGGRRFGSSGSLEIDLRTMTPEDARRHLHQTTHDVICSLILWQQVIGAAK